MPPILLNARELADRLDARYSDVLEWTRRGYIPAMRVSGSYVYNLARVVAALRERSVRLGAEATELAEAATA